MDAREATLLLPSTSTPLLVSQEDWQPPASAASAIVSNASTLGFSPTDPVSGREIANTDQLLRSDFSGTTIFVQVNQSKPIARARLVAVEDAAVVHKDGADAALFYSSQYSLPVVCTSVYLSLSHPLVLWSHYHPLQPARIRIELASPNDARGICEPGQRTNAIAVSFYPKVELADDMELKTEIIFLIDRSGSMAGISNVVRSVFRSLTLTH